MAAASPVLSLVRSPSLVPVPTEGAPHFAPEPGTLLELSGQGSSARLTLCVSLAIRAQALGETVIWITPDTSGVYGADLAISGLDLDALAVARIPAKSGPKGLVRAAELALRSGGFGFCAIDFVSGAPSGPPASWQGRLLGLAREHRASIVLLSQKPTDADSLGPLVSVRIEPRRARGDEPEHARVEHDLVKVKHGGLTRVAPSRHRLPAGA
jgi:hypothetical protein